MNKFLLKFLMTIAALSLILSACAPAATPTAGAGRTGNGSTGSCAAHRRRPPPTPEAPVDLEIWVGRPCDRSRPAA